MILNICLHQTLFRTVDISLDGLFVCKAHRLYRLYTVGSLYETINSWKKRNLCFIACVSVKPVLLNCMHHAFPIQFGGSLHKITMLSIMITFRPFYWLQSFMGCSIDFGSTLWKGGVTKKNQ